MRTRLIRALLLRGGGLSVVVGVSLGAAAPPRVQFTDTQLKNGLRVLIAEDHSAPCFRSPSPTTSAHATNGRDAQALPICSNT